MGRVGEFGDSFDEKEEWKRRKEKEGERKRKRKENEESSFKRW
jgi:hypothetical protein